MLRNEFAFSFSAFKLFKTCPRSYWIAKVLAWGGWERNAAPEKRLAYLLGKIETFYTRAGKIVHDLAAAHVQRPRLSRPNENALASFAASQFDSSIRQSLSNEWHRDPKWVCNLFEHYYPGRGRETATQAAALERAVTAARNLATTSTLVKVDAAGTRPRVERLEKSNLAGVPVWVQLDLEIERGGRLLIVDWKTGRVRAEDRMQTLLYTAFAVETLGYRLHEVDVRLDYLALGKTDDEPAGLGDVQRMLELLPGAASEIRQRLNGDGSVIEGPIENFPMVTDYRVCARCKFHEICYGQREMIDMVEPVAADEED